MLFRSIQTGGNFNIVGAGGSAGTLTLNVGGNFTLSGGAFNVQANPNGGTGSLNIAGNYTQSGGVFDFNNNANSSSTSIMYLAGNFSNTVATGTSMTTSSSSAPNGTIVFNGTVSQNISFANANTTNYINYTINSSSNCQLLSNIALYGENSYAQFYANFIVNGILDVGTYTITDGGDGYNGGSGETVFTLNSGATLITANAGGIDGSIPSANTTKTFSTGANYIYDGTSAQVTGVSLTGANNLTINNSTGVTLSSPTTVSGVLTLTSGILTTTTTNLLSVTNTATTAITGSFSNSTFINGPVQWTLPTSLASGSTYNFRVGSGSTYLPFSLVNPTTGTGAFTALVQ